MIQWILDKKNDDTFSDKNNIYELLNDLDDINLNDARDTTIINN